MHPENSSGACIQPRVTQAEIRPLDTPNLKKLMESMKGHETLIMVAIFTGMRSGELRGLTWDCVDFKNGLIRMPKQLVQSRMKGKKFHYRTLNLEAHRFHDLRHTFATLALQNGDDMKTVSASLGHATVAFTLDVYGHVTDKMQRDSTDRMQALIDASKAKRGRRFESRKG